MLKEITDEDKVSIIENRCLKCNRKIRSDKSVLRQHGLTCWKKELELRALRNQLKIEFV